VVHISIQIPTAKVITKRAAGKEARTMEFAKLGSW